MGWDSTCQSSVLSAGASCMQEFQAIQTWMNTSGETAELNATAGNATAGGNATEVTPEEAQSELMAKLPDLKTALGGSCNGGERDGGRECDRGDPRGGPVGAHGEAPRPEDGAGRVLQRRDHAHVLRGDGAHHLRQVPVPGEAHRAAQGGDGPGPGPVHGGGLQDPGRARVQRPGRSAGLPRVPGLKARGE